MKDLEQSKKEWLSLLCSIPFSLFLCSCFLLKLLPLVLQQGHLLACCYLLFWFCGRKEAAFWSLLWQLWFDNGCWFYEKGVTLGFWLDGRKEGSLCDFWGCARMVFYIGTRIFMEMLKMNSKEKWICAFKLLLIQILFLK